MTYLAIALLAMEADALACYLAKVRYRLLISACLALLWPLTVPITIWGIAKETEAL